MITTFRIDERLIHGQIIATWLKSLGITHLVVANNEVAENEFQQRMLKLAVPSSVKCLIKNLNDSAKILNDPRCEQMRIMLIVGNPKDAVEMLENVPGIEEINLANYGSITKPEVENKKSISPMVYLDEEDILYVNKVIDFGKVVFTQKTPVEQKKVLKRI